jgi:hypothetical protein
VAQEGSLGVVDLCIGEKRWRWYNTGLEELCNGFIVVRP